MNIEFLATVAVIAPDPISSCKLYVEALDFPCRVKRLFAGERGEDDAPGCLMREL